MQLQRLSQTVDDDDGPGDRVHRLFARSLRRPAAPLNGRPNYRRDRPHKGPLPHHNPMRTVAGDGALYGTTLIVAPRAGPTALETVALDVPSLDAGRSAAKARDDADRSSRRQVDKRVLDIEFVEVVEWDGGLAWTTGLTASWPSSPEATRPSPLPSPFLCRRYRGTANCLPKLAQCSLEQPNWTSTSATACECRAAHLKWNPRRRSVLTTAPPPPPTPLHHRRCRKPIPMRDLAPSDLDDRDKDRQGHRIGDRN